MSQYRLSEKAKEDLIRIHHYGMAQFGEQQADRYFDAFFDQFERIASNPKQYPSVSHIRPGYHRCVSGVDSIYYRVKNGIVEIIRILGRQDIEGLF